MRNKQRHSLPTCQALSSLFHMPCHELEYVPECSCLPGSSGKRSGEQQEASGHQLDLRPRSLLFTHPIRFPGHAFLPLHPYAEVRRGAPGKVAGRNITPAQRPLVTVPLSVKQQLPKTGRKTVRAKTRMSVPDLKSKRCQAVAASQRTLCKAVSSQSAGQEPGRHETTGEQ